MSVQLLILEIQKKKSQILKILSLLFNILPLLKTLLNTLESVFRLYFYFLRLILLLCTCPSMCLWSVCHASAGNQQTSLNPMEWELQMVVACPMWVLGIKLRFSAKQCH